MTSSPQILRVSCITLFGHLKASFNWSQTDTHFSQFCITLISASQAYISLCDVGAAIQHPRIIMLAQAIPLLQITLGATSIVLYARGLHRYHTGFEAGRLYGPYERMLQIANLVCCIAFFRIHTASVAWKCATLLLQVIDLSYSCYCGNKQQQMREATRCVLRQVESCENTIPSDVKPYYHLLTLANDHVKDVVGSEFRSILLSMIQKADEDSSYAKELTDWTLSLAMKQNGEVIKKELGFKTLEYSRSQSRRT